MSAATRSALPGGALLASDEQVLGSDAFLMSNLWVFPDLRLKLALTNKRLIGERPNTLLGLFRIGSDKMSYPLHSISGVETTTRIAVGPMLLGLGWFAIALVYGLQRGWLFLVLGALFLLYCYRAHLTIQNSGGGVIRHRIAVWNKGAAQAFAQRINTVIAEQLR